MLHIFLFGLVAVGIVFWFAAGKLRDPVEARRVGVLSALVVVVILVTLGVQRRTFGIGVTTPFLTVKWEWTDWIGLIALLLVMAGLLRGGVSGEVAGPVHELGARSSERRIKLQGSLSSLLS